MKPIRLAKDNVLRFSRDRTGIGWPTCAQCFQPVHGYGIVAERKLSNGTREIDVYGECCHPRAGPGERIDCRCGPDNGTRDYKILSVPKDQTKDQFVKSLGLLVFFTPSGAA